MKINKKLLMAALASAVIVSAPQVKAYTLSNAESVATNTGIGLSEEKPQAPVRAPQKATDPNYAEDEAKIKDFSDSERYRATQMEQGNGPAFSISGPEMDFLDGFRYNTLEPSATSEDQTLWGLEFEFDKEKGQRTYTDFYFTNTGGFGRPTLLEAGKIPANEIGDNLSVEHGFKDPNYKAKAEVDIFASNVNRNLNLYSTVDDLEHINNINNTNTIIAWKGNYTKDNPNGSKATQGTSSAFGFTVNPWPNENDQLSVIKLNGSHNQKEFVQGQTITTKVKVENLDENARERLVGQVYHPITGEVVPGAKAYINENDYVVVEMPKGAIDEKGNINKGSIFYKDPKYKALQNLEVKFFARPRTEEEFRAIGIAANYGEDHYTSTGAGTETINHKGKDVLIDKQGIDRYDHYNEIGRFKINLDDTRYYDQAFKKPNGEDTTKHTSISVKPEEEFIVDLYVPEDKKDKNVFPNQKTPEEMEAAKAAKQAIGSIDWQFINKINEGKKPEDQWKLEYDESTLPTTFKITPPKSAKAGEFVAVPLTYTYTNGSTDTHWFHFVVQESTNNVPEYYVQVEYPSEEQKSLPDVPKDDKKLPPKRYTIPDGTEFKDDKGNEWTVSIDDTTGEVTAQPKDPSKFDGGETLTVPVVAHYEDPLKPDEDITEETKAEFVIKERANMTPRYNAKAGKAGDELSSEVILDDTDKYNRRPGKYTLDSPTYTDDKSNTWNVTIDEKTGKVTATVPNGEGDEVDGALLNVPVKAHYYETDGTEIATKEVEVQFIASGTDGTYVKKEDIPFETKVEKDPELKKGEIRVIQEGKVGSKEVTYVIKDSQIDESKTTEKILEKPQERLIHVGEGTEDGKHEIKETVEVPYEVEIEFDDKLASGEQKVTQEGIPGEKTRTTTITIQDGKVTNVDEGEYTETKAPKKKIIKVGANTEGKVEHKEEIPFKYDVQYDPNFYINYPDAKDNYKVVTKGVAGEKTTTWTIKNSEIVEGPTQKVTKEPVDAVIKVGQKDYTGTFETKKTKVIEFETKYVVDNSLEPGTTKVEQEGELGEEVTAVTHTIVNGEVTKSVDGETTRKEPKDRIVKVGPAKTDGTHEYTNKIPYEVEIRVNPELKKDERRIIQKGEVGEEKYTIKIENSKVVETSDPVVTKEAKKEIIEVGTEDYTGEFEYVDKEVIPFDTEVRINPNLEPNQIKEITPGENGSKERKITQKYTNGEKGDLVVGEYKTTKEPVTRVIEVGPGKTDGTHTYTSKKPFEVEVRVNPKLPKGEYKILQKGVDGEEEYTITIENSEVTNISDPKETKAPVNEIIEVGEGSTDGEVKHVEEIPFKYQVEESEDLKPGEYKIVKPGKVGTKTTIWTIKDSKVVGDPKEEIVEAEDALIQVGKGTPDGTHDFKEKKEIPFETIIEYDDSLEPGEEKVVQEGKPGEQERTNTIVIENGKVKEIKEGTFETITKPVNKIIKIGRKKAEDETTKTVEKEIPYETKIIYDDTLEAGFQQIEKEGKPGKEKVTITTKIVDGKLVTTESTEKIEDKEDRVVRIGVKPVVKETELGHDTEYRYNPELKEGEEKVIEEGSNGKVEYTITFNKEKGKIEVTEKRTEPKNKIVEIGYKTDGKVKVESEIPFEVEIIEDPEMEAGKTEVVQEGKLGKKETTVTIENSKEVSREENIIKEPVKKIIKVGTKNVCEIPPVKPEDPTDPEQPGGEDPKDPEKPGEDPKDPEKPGEDPKDPEKPGEDPKDPEKPGEDPKDPEKPGEDPKDPEKPGKEDPKDPEAPGEDSKDPDKDPGKEDSKDPDQPGEDPKDTAKDPGKTPEENGKTPENNGKTPENNGKTPENNGKTPGATGQVDGKSTTTNNKTPKRLPKSGSESEIITLAMSGLLAAAGFIGLKKKRKDQ